MSDAVVYELQNSVAVLRVDDGKANAFSFTLIEALHAALDRAEKEAKAVAWIGRAERFSGGFDLGVMRSGDLAAVGKLVAAGGRLALRLYEAPLPIVLGCTGHALAMGAVALLAADLRVGPLGDFQDRAQRSRDRSHAADFATELARERPRRATCSAPRCWPRLHDGPGAVEAGFLDLVAPADKVEGVAIEAARASPRCTSAPTTPPSVACARLRSRCCARASTRISPTSGRAPIKRSGGVASTPALAQPRAERPLYAGA
jgi:enoyl-CoA hydratase